MLITIQSLAYCGGSDLAFLHPAGEEGAAGGVRGYDLLSKTLAVIGNPGSPYGSAMASSRAIS